METHIQDQLLKLSSSIIEYLPNLLGGILLILLGWLVGWICKRVVVQIFIILRLDRFLRNTRWRSSVSKADVRYGIANFTGNIAYAIVFFIFVDNALVAWKLNILSDLLNRGILFLPKVIIACAIFGAGWLMASWVQLSVMKSLRREKIQRASLISKLVKWILLLFFSAVAFVQLDIAREIIIIGFATVFVTLSVIIIILSVSGVRNYLKKIEGEV
jgi:hypothetical protein